MRQDVAELRAVVLSLARLVLEGALACGLLASAVWLSPRLALWALLMLPLAVLPVFLYARRTQQRSYGLRRTAYVLFDVILQLMRGIRIIKAYGAAETEARSALAKGHAYFDELIEMVRVQSLARMMLESLAGLGVVVTVVVGGLEVLAGRLDWPSLLAFLMCLRGLQGPLNNVTAAFMEIKRRDASLSRITELLAIRSEVPECADAVPLPPSPLHLAFDGVSFRFREAMVLRDVSFEVRAGEWVGIAGPSGAGKSTLLGLLARFNDATSGAVRYDGNRRAVVAVRPTCTIGSPSSRKSPSCSRPACGTTSAAAVRPQPTPT